MRVDGEGGVELVGVGTHGGHCRAQPVRSCEAGRGRGNRGEEGGRGGAGLAGLPGLPSLPERKTLVFPHNWNNFDRNCGLLGRINADPSELGHSSSDGAFQADGFLGGSPRA